MKTKCFALLAALLTAACVVPVAVPVPAIAAEKPLAGTWRITGAEGLQRLAPSTAVSFDARDMQFNVRTNCNSLFGRYEHSAGNQTLRFKDMASTLKACPDMVAEQRLAESLAQVHRYRLQGNGLELLDAQGRVLIRGKRTGAE